MQLCAFKRPGKACLLSFQRRGDEGDEGDEELRVRFRATRRPKDGADHLTLWDRTLQFELVGDKEEFVSFSAIMSSGPTLAF